MFGNKTMQAIDKLADEELLYSKVQHKERFASLHEAESIIREELEEMEEEVASCRDAFDELHKAVRYGKLYDACDAKAICNGLRLCATCAAVEAIQLAAMCKKLDEFCEEGVGKMKTEIEWIPVGEKLPEPESEVLVTVHGKTTDDLSVWYGVRYDKGWELSRFDDYLDTRYTDDFEVTAWAHMQEPYKEGAD